MIKHTAVRFFLLLLLLLAVQMFVPTSVQACTSWGNPDEDGTYDLGELPEIEIPGYPKEDEDGPCEGSNYDPCECTAFPDPCNCLGDCGGSNESGGNNNSGNSNVGVTGPNTGTPPTSPTNPPANPPNPPTNPPSTPTILPAISISYTAQQYQNTGGYVKGSCSCMCVAQKVMKEILGNNATNIGSSANEMRLWQESNGEMTLVGNANSVFNTLNAHLGANRSVIVGIDYKPGHTGNLDMTTDHWIVVNGRGYDNSKGQYYYNYVETGRWSSNGTGATSDSNRLYYDSEDGTFTNPNGYLGDYELTQIRPNQ